MVNHKSSNHLTAFEILWFINPLVQISEEQLPNHPARYRGSLVIALVRNLKTCIKGARWWVRLLGTFISCIVTHEIEYLWLMAMPENSYL